LIRIIFSAVGRLISLSVDETHKLAFTPPCPPKGTPCTLQQSSTTPDSITIRSRPRATASRTSARPLGNGQPGPEPKSSRRATASRAPNPGEALEKRKKLLDSPIICSCCLPGCFSPPTPCVFFSFLHPREGLQPGRGCRAFSNYFSSPSTVRLVFSRPSASQTHAHTVVPTNIEQF
jgi:hypothetical protein